MIRFDKSFLYYKLPPVLFAALIIIVSTIASAAPPSLGVRWSDKIYHTAEYFVFGLLIFRAFPHVHQSPRQKLYYALLFLFGLAYGAIDERAQYYIVDSHGRHLRDSSPYDWMADAVGYLLAGLVFLLVRRWLSRRRKALEVAEKKADEVKT